MILSCPKYWENKDELDIDLLMVVSSAYLRLGKDFEQEKVTTEDEMIGWHHQLNGHEFGGLGSW